MLLSRRWARALRRDRGAPEEKINRFDAFFINAIRGNSCLLQPRCFGERPEAVARGGCASVLGGVAMAAPTSTPGGSGSEIGSARRRWIYIVTEMCSADESSGSAVC